MYLYQTNSNRHSIVPREDLPADDSPFYVYHNQTTISTKHSNSLAFQLPTYTANQFHINIHVLTSSYNIAQLQRLITRSINRFQTTQSLATNSPSSHDSPETFAFINTLCILLQEANPARFADIINTTIEHVVKIQDEVYELTQKLFYFEFFNKITFSVEHLKQLEDSHHQFRKHLTSTFRKCYHFLTAAQELLDLQLLFFSTLRIFATTNLGLDFRSTVFLLFKP